MQKSYQKFVIISSERSVSNLLSFLLHSHPRIISKGELFMELGGETCQRIWNEVFTEYEDKIDAVGFKIFYDHPFDSDDISVWELVNDRSIKKILLTRENVVKNYVSFQIALDTKLWLSHNG